MMDIFGAIDALGVDHNMRRDRPYSGQPHTYAGERGRQEVRGLTMRDILDCYIRAVCLSAGPQAPAHYEEACKGENATLCENDLYTLNWNEIDPVAISQNLICEIEQMMGIFPNIGSHHDEQED